MVVGTVGTMGDSKARLGCVVEAAVVFHSKAPISGSHVHSPVLLAVTSAVSLTHLFSTVFSTGHFSKQPSMSGLLSESGLMLPSQEKCPSL